jgi:glucose-1-phosphate thymidylyltransferase
MKIVGLIPAAGQAKRLPQLPCSKEIFPIGMDAEMIDGKKQYRPRPIASYLIEKMVFAGAQKVILIISREKTDILRYFGSGESLNTHISYLVQEKPSGMPDALNQARPWLDDATVLFGMPDTIFKPYDAFKQLLSRHQAEEADLTLGLFSTQKPEKFGMVAFDQQYHMNYTIDKPKKTNLEYMWGIACWQPAFTQFMGKFLKILPLSREIVLAEIFQSGLEAGLKVSVVPFINGRYIDIGTPDDLLIAISEFSVPNPPD